MRAAPLRLAFFGLPLAALLLARDGHDLVFVASCRRDALGNRRAARRFGNRFVFKPRVDDPRLVARVRASSPDLLVSWFWTTRLPPALIALCPLGGFGVHPSLLPRHRGPDPYYWAIREGDALTGVTAHRLAADYDTGAILDRRTLAIDPSWNAWQLARALDRPSLALLRETVSRFAAGDPPPDEAQDDSLATYAPLPGDEAMALRFARPTDEVLRQIRALAPAPGAYTEIAGELVTVTKADRSVWVPRTLEAGEAMVHEGRAVVRTRDGAVALLAGEVEGVALDAAGLATLVTKAKGPA